MNILFTMPHKSEWGIWFRLRRKILTRETEVIMIWVNNFIIEDWS